MPRSFNHLRLLSRLDLYVLVRLRAGVDKGQDTCTGADDPFYMTTCLLYQEDRPDIRSLFSDKDIPLWKKWLTSHYYLGYGIPSTTQNMAGCMIAYGDPFDDTAVIIRDGRHIVVDIARPVRKCDKCGRVHKTVTCPLPNFRVNNLYFYVRNGLKLCLACGIANIAGTYKSIYLRLFLSCGVSLTGMWFRGLRLVWDRVPDEARTMLVSQIVTKQERFHMTNSYLS